MGHSGSFCRRQGRSLARWLWRVGALWLGSKTLASRHLKRHDLGGQGRGARCLDWAVTLSPEGLIPSELVIKMFDESLGDAVTVSSREQR